MMSSTFRDLEGSTPGIAQTRGPAFKIFRTHVNKDPDMVIYKCYLSTGEVEADGSLVLLSQPTGVNW